MVCILSRGHATSRGNLLAKGAYWGDDNLLSNAQLRIHVTVRAVTFIEVASISGEALLLIAAEGGYIPSLRGLRRYVCRGSWLPHSPPFPQPAFSTALTLPALPRGTGTFCCWRCDASSCAATTRAA